MGSPGLPSSSLPAFHVPCVGEQTAFGCLQRGDYQGEVTSKRDIQAFLSQMMVNFANGARALPLDATQSLDLLLNKVVTAFE